MTARSLEDFLATQRRLLSLEREAEAEEVRRDREELSESERVHRGTCLRGLEVVEESSGPGGRSLVRLYSFGGLAAHRFQPGDLVELFARDRPGDAVGGVVYRSQKDMLLVALGEDDSPPATKGLRMERGADDLSWRRVEDVLRRLEKLDDPEEKRLRDVLLGARQPGFDAGATPPGPGLRDRQTLDDRLDPSQRDAVQHALGAHDLALIHGPPGTGKTTALVELIRRSAAAGQKILVCAPSNVAVDNLVERLVEHGLPVVRIGHPARLLPSLVRHSLDSWLERSDARGFAAAARKDLLQARRQMRDSRDREERRQLQQSIRDLRQEVRRHERSAVDEVLADCSVVAATCIGAADHALRDRHFDLVVVDEAAQALEATCWVPALRGARLVLAGDHHQLGPLLRSPAADDPALRASLFERMAALHPTAVRMLRVQYRMHQDVMDIVSDPLYGGLLEAHPSVVSHRLADLQGVEQTPNTTPVLRFVDTAGCDLDETQESEGSSRWNEGEVRLVSQHVHALVEAGLPPDRIGVITPYNAQVEALRHALYDLGDAVEIGSVDGFQGREKEAMVISMVRSNPRGELGFLVDDRRSNVAFTRARRQLTVFGDSATLGRHAFLAEFIAHCEARGGYESAWSFL